ncbi:MAG: SAM-dependent methyltransferase [Halobacteriota archaeon]|nr:SAM-dependent methyltransferase [Halobacteriota archaeon]
MLSSILSIILFAFVCWILWSQAIGAEFVPTSMATVRKMLSMADVTPEDIVYDLGSGDGRTIITASKEFGARSVGIEADPLRLIWSRLRIRRWGLTDRTDVIWGNFFHKDLSEANVVTLYLFQSTNDKLVEKFEKELRPGTRVISHAFIFKQWKPIKTDEKRSLFLYEIGGS